MNKWLSVKSWLPMPNQRVLCYKESAGVQIADYIWNEGFEDEGFIQDITHWMDCPEKPKK